MSETPIKRFYKEAAIVEADGGYGIALDGRQAKTVGKNSIVTSSKPLAEAIAAEWHGQGEHLDLAAMPLSRLQGFVLDGGTAGQAEWRETISQYGRTDLLCYRASDRDLAARQMTAWQPVLDQVGNALGGVFLVTDTIISIEQPTDLLAAFDGSLTALSPSEGLAGKLITEITGSAILAWAVLHDHVTPETALEVSRLDDTYQAEKWGVDEEAAAREALINGEYETIVAFLRLGRT